MVSVGDLTSSLTLCLKKRQSIRDQMDALTNLDIDLSKEEQALHVLIEVGPQRGNEERRVKQLQLAFSGMNSPDKISTQISARRPSKGNRGKKPDVQVIEDILREYGPLHVTNIVQLAQPMGVLLSGSKKPTLMVRDKMVACKRFKLFGNNVWGLPGQELPGDVHSNGHTPTELLAQELN